MKTKYILFLALAALGVLYLLAVPEMNQPSKLTQDNQLTPPNHERPRPTESTAVIDEKEEIQTSPENFDTPTYPTRIDTKAETLVEERKQLHASFSTLLKQADESLDDETLRTLNGERTAYAEKRNAILRDPQNSDNGTLNSRGVEALNEADRMFEQTLRHFYGDEMVNDLTSLIRSEKKLLDSGYPTHNPPAFMPLLRLE